MPLYFHPIATRGLYNSPLKGGGLYEAGGLAANFASSLTGGLLLSLLDMSTGGPTSWNWDFGDGTTTSSQNPTKAYSAEGLYPVSLTASSPDGTSIYLANVAVVNTDGPNNVLLPTSSAGYVALGEPIPYLLWNCQDVSSSAGLVPSIGTSSLVPDGGSHAYQLSVTSWNRKAVGTHDGEDTAWASAGGDMADPNTTSVTWFALLAITGTVAANRLQMLVDNSVTPLLRVGQTADQKFQLNCSGSTTAGTISGSAYGGVFPFVMQYDRTNTRFMVYTTREAITGTFNPVMLNSGKSGLGVVTTAAGQAGPWRFLSLACFTGSAAERDFKQVLKNRGWPVIY